MGINVGNPKKRKKFISMNKKTGKKAKQTLSIRTFIKNIITKEEANTFIPGKQPLDNDIIKSILSKIGKKNCKPPSYAVVEQDNNGHNWHTDIGTNGHMDWCNLGVSILLKKSKGGLFKYKHPEKEYTQEQHYLNAIVHSSDEWHMVEESSKGRTVLLMFLQ